ncbi:hypothetical protein [Athalassotoga saccharophila]|uniref:hypothetical protein n=1 Tax=Athalassotoga saccharophila TaxID=1441386 RepID=UPI00137AC072|nr:hypothetical protein [Athalassotoga saccharophila]BBJ27146.1 drug/metabolite transporter (DMT) superfamily [Athalassotoga saccharophila]
MIKSEPDRILEISESAILGGLTSLIYTMQLITGIGTAISYLSLIPLFYAGRRSLSEWVKVSIVSSVFIFTFNDIGGSLFFILFMVPLSLSLLIRFYDYPLAVSSIPIFSSLILILSKFSWMVGFSIPSFLKDFWVILAFGFSALIVELFLKFIHNVIEKFEISSRGRVNVPSSLILIFGSVVVFSVYGLSFSTIFSIGAIYFTFFFEIAYESLMRESSKAFKRVVDYILNVIRHIP